LRNQPFGQWCYFRNGHGRILCRHQPQAGPELARYIQVRSDLQQKFEDIKIKLLTRILEVVNPILTIVEAIVPSGEGISAAIESLTNPLGAIAAPLTLTDLDRQVRDWFRARCEALGCTVTVDDMGAMFARRPGQRADVPPIAMGSHLDTQPTGGKFDGVLGVLGALEALRTLREAGYETFAPIEVVNWTNEEGSRFAPAMVSSGVFGGAFDRDWAVSRQDRDGVTFVAVLLVDRAGVKGGETRVFDAEGPQGIRFTMRDAWTTLLLDDERVLHETTPIQPLAEGGHRDTLVLTFRSGGFQGP